MLSMLDSGADSVKRAYTSFMDFAVVPFFYATWYDESLFKDPNYFTYAYLASVGLTFAAKEIAHRYKQVNPELSEDDYHKLVKFIDSFFEGVSNSSQLVFPAIIIDVIYGLKELFSAHALKIIHPTFLSACGAYGLYKGVEKYGFFESTRAQEKVIYSDGARLSINSSEDIMNAPNGEVPGFSEEEYLPVSIDDNSPLISVVIENN